VRLEGKRILVSGATGGLGRAISGELAAAGARLVLSARRGPELEELARSLPGGAELHSSIVADLALEGAAERLVSEAGDLDALVANAGMNAPGRLERSSPEQLESIIRVNLEVPIRMTRALLPSLQQKGEGHIVFISSLNGRAATPRTSLYCATKFGLRGFALALREDLHSRGVGVSIVSPGLVREAGMFADSGARAPAVMGTTTPAKVGRAVVESIARNRGEIAVAPLRQRLLAGFAARYPELAGRATRRGDRAGRVADEVAAGHSGRR